MPLDAEARAILDSLASGPEVDPFTISPAVMRLAFEAMTGPQAGPEVALIEMREANGPAGPIPVRVYTPPGEGLKPALVYFHGGGFVVCSLDSHASICRELAIGANCVVVSVDYRLAPEAKFPAAPDDCYAATKWVAEQATSLGIDPKKIAVAGDSAGGNLAAVVALMCRDRDDSFPMHQLLIYPVTDCRFDTDSYGENATGYFLTARMMQWFWHHYLESPPDSGFDFDVALARDGDNPLASPLRSPDLTGLAGATILTAEFDPLRDEGRAYADRLKKAGVETRYTNYPGVFHGFFGMSAQIPRARLAVDEVCAALRQAFRA